MESELERLKKDAERYRRLAFLVEFGAWSVAKFDIKDSYGNHDETHMINKAHMDLALDRKDVIDDADACAHALKWDSTIG
jgi:hypothetical protein